MEKLLFALFLLLCTLSNSFGDFLSANQIFRQHFKTFPSCREKTLFPDGQLIEETPPWQQMSSSDLPENWFWGNVSGINLLTRIRNQNVPQYCGACWSFAVTSALSDRLSILRNGSWPEINLSPQVLINCNGGGNCEGGNPGKAYSYIHKYGISDETCRNYEAVNGDCSPMGVCENCDPGPDDAHLTPGNCYPVQNYTRYYVGDFGHISGVFQMKAEIYKRGPISCGIFVTDELSSYQGGVFEQDVEFSALNHEVSVVGWGMDSETGKEHWIVRNSMGSEFGEEGFFKIAMYGNNLGIEEDCSFGVPLWNQSTAWKDLHHKTPFPFSKDDSNHLRPSQAPKRSKHYGHLEPQTRPSFVISELPHHTLEISEIPAFVDPRYSDGSRDYTTVVRNQHIPFYCGSCWAQASSSALSDRIKIHRKAAFPEVTLSAQVLVNCVKGGSAGCHGGSPSEAYEYVRLHGLTDDSCASYQSIDLECSPLNICKTCSSPGVCEPVKDPQLYYVKEHGQVSGEAAMMAEIYLRGPIVCGVSVTDEFEHYAGGIFEDKTGATQVNHDIEVAGFGEEKNETTGQVTKYWIARNSWGTYWGEKGWFRIVRGVNNLAIESNCDWAVPDL
eukprot:Sdes_comp22342_c0_seq1m20824